jgi:metallo-beta-lactamase family protein
MHLLEVAGRRLLLDCGLYQGHRAEAYQRNSQFPFPARSIDALVLSHAHTDHCGNLPNLVRQGFSGPIYATPATRDLAAIMMADSAKIQQEDFEYHDRHHPAGQATFPPLYSQEDVDRTVHLFRPVRYDTPLDLGHGVQLQLVDAGHLLGSAMVSLRIPSGGKEHTLTYTGDLGRRNLPILRDPAPVPPADLLISECTYGGKTHEAVEESAANLDRVIRRTVAQGGKVLIPAFSLGRTQTIVYFLHQLMQSGLPAVPIFVDSPLAVEATAIFRRHPECFDEETLRLLRDDPDLFGGRRIQYLRSVEDSKKLNDRREPCVIIAASGMCEGGRIVHHLKHNIGDPHNTVLLIGFQAPDTLGRRIQERRPEVRIHEQMRPLRAEVVTLSGFSSHADHKDLLDFLGPLAGRVKQVRLVHGEMDSAEALATALHGQGFADVVIPARGESVKMAE